MHRKTFLPRFLGWGLVLGLLFTALLSTTSAQNPDHLPGFGQQLKDGGDAKGGAKEVPEPYLLLLAKDSTRQIEMSTKELIAEFRSENPKVVKVQALLDNPRAVLVTGVGSGSTRVFITDVKKNTESLEVRVPLDEEADREAKRKDLLEQIRAAVPTASVDVRPSGNNTVVLTGNVALAESIQPILDLTRGVFGPAVNISNAMRIGGVQQVQLEVTIAIVDRSRMRQIGFSFLETGNQHFFSSTVAGGVNMLTTQVTLPSITGPSQAFSSSPNVAFGIFNDKQGFFGYLTALTTEGMAKLISEPRVVTMSGKTASIVSGGETPILTSSGTGAPTVTYKQFGTVVNFLPIVMGNGKIYLDVRPEVSNINAANGININTAVGAPTTVPGFDIRSAQVAVELEDGQTLAIGGLIQNKITAQNTKVPILGDIPFLAFFFTNKTFSETEEEMLILVTPHLVDPMACNQLPKYLPGRETRSPDDFELFLEGILEAPRGQRNLTHPYTAAYLNGPGASTFPCGDSSGSGRCGAKGCSGTCATGNCGSASAGVQMNATARPMSPYGVEAATPTPASMAIREPVPVTTAPATTPALPTLPPETNAGPATQVPFIPAAFGPAVMTDR